MGVLDRFFLPCAAALLVCMAAVQVASIRQESQTYDEGTHLAAGLSYWRTGDYRMNPEHPPLGKLLCALPLLFLDVRLPFQYPSWEQHDELNFGAQFLYTNRLSADQILFPARLVTIALTVSLGIAIAWWTRRHFGSAAGLLALLLFAFDPNIIAHGRYVTTDLIVTLFIFLACVLWGEVLMRPTLARAAIAGAALGLALASKFTALFLLPLLLAMALLRWPGWKATAGAGLTAYAALMLTYQPDLLRGFGILPRAFLSGLRMVMHQYGAGGRPAYLLGQVSDQGWWYYFPVAYLVKAPAALLALLLLAIALLVWKRPQLPFAAVVVAIPAAAYWLLCLGSHMDIGIRHLLPAYVLMLPLIAFVAVRWAPAWLTLALGIALIGESASVYPHYLAFFNWPSGGPAEGPRYLLDSNIDWGQDTKKLKSWLDERGIHEICDVYFGVALPTHYGIVEHRLLGEDPNLDCMAAASVTPLYGLYVPKDRYRWLRERTPEARIGYSIYLYDLRKKR